MTDKQKTQQIEPSLEVALEEQIKTKLLNLHTMLPGIIASFDPVRQTAQVQPCIKRLFIDKGAVNLPLCVDVPVEFPGGGGFFLTFPVKVGDECVLSFSERAIDYWYLNGGVQLPAEYRLHDLSDAIARVGLNSQPKNIPSFKIDGTQLRSRDGEFYIEIDDNGKVRIQAQDIELHANHSYSWDVNGFGERWTHLSGSNYERRTWQTGATITNVPLPINPPEGP